MFSEVVKLVPQMDQAGLSNMFRDLSSRFSSVAKKFGDGMKNALKFGGLAAIGGALIAKLLNPLEHAEEVIDRILHKGDDAVTNAQEFGTTPGKLLRLEGLGKAKGVDPETMRQLLGKFQTALAKEQDAAAAPARIQEKLSKETDPQKRLGLEADLKAATVEKAKGGTLHEFIGIKDTADAFFQFIQSLGQVDKAQQTVVQGQVFGERVRGKASEFFNSTPAELADVLKQLPSADVLSKAAEKSNKLSDRTDLLTAVRESNTFVTQSGLVNNKMVDEINQSKTIADQKDNEGLKRFDSLKTASIAIQELTEKFDQLATEIVTNIAPPLLAAIKDLAAIAPSVKEIKDTVSGGFDSALEEVANLSVAVGDLWDKGADTINSVTEKVSGAVTDLENVWTEFKTSRIYRTFGGGKK